MMVRVFICLSLLLLPACAGAPTLPTSEKLEIVKREKMAALREEMQAQNLEMGTPVYIRLFKKEAVLEVWVQEPKSQKYTLFKNYPICNYSGELGPKLREGDHQAPEGFYRVGAGQMNPWSRFHLSFDLGFPNQYDRALGRTGSDLMIHGDCKSDGCYALSDPVIEEIYLLVEASIASGSDVPVHIFPFRMDEGNLLLNMDSPWSSFWDNLKQGYDAFEKVHIPPEVSYERAGHRALKYVFDVRD